MSWLKKLFAKDAEVEGVKQVKADVSRAQLDYPPKIMLAWIKTLEGHKDLGLWLLDNGYPEIYHTTQAILLKEEARSWLTNNGFPHLLAMVNAAEGNENAQRWLQLHGFEVLYQLAMAVEGEMNSFAWLKAHTDQFLFELAKAIKHVKDKIEFNHNDMYSFGKDI
jgi:hypothetical protein